MAKAGRYLHNPSDDTSVAGVSTAYNTGKVHVLDMKSVRPYGNANVAFKGFIEGLIFRVESLTGGAAKATVRLCADADGDIPLVGDVEVDLDLGVTTATSGSGQIYYDSFPFENVGDDNIYIFYKVDAGSATVSYSQLSWSE